MNKKFKIILGTISLIVVGMALFIAIGLYGMEIEDRYGDNQDIFYRSRQGDIVVNHQTKEFGEIKKTWTRFYVVNKLDTIDTNDWWDDKNIEIYKVTDLEPLDKSFNYSEFEKLKEEGKLELKMKLR
ncbi:hypothetical protein [Pontibacter indicus]|uniref:DUF3139 domain-containing protein n=1 Tax=Pontibacter indicus TaxID=1317125 RepID=A0A1R3XTS6_9BACT|nr:hypothetical protein [Pontibacter indicus]SIT94823.1 hypothetical protein SAMN05444128_3796 [Pontibacter indicus]